MLTCDGVVSGRLPPRKFTLVAGLISSWIYVLEFHGAYWPWFSTVFLSGLYGHYFLLWTGGFL